MEIEDIEELAQLSRVDLTDAEKKDLLKDTEDILSFVDQIQEVVTEEPLRDSRYVVEVEQLVKVSDVNRLLFHLEDSFQGSLPVLTLDERRILLECFGEECTKRCDYLGFIH